MRERIHGGNWAAYEREYGKRPLDFSANVSPLGVPEGVREAIRGAAGEIDRYPDPACHDLCEAIARHEGRKPEQVLCGSGASDLLYRAVYAIRPRHALITAPCFGEYEAALETVGCSLTRAPLGDMFRINESFLTLIDNNIDLIILCQPNNPSGITIDPSILRRIIAHSAGRHGAPCRVLVDECFVDLLDDPEAYSVKRLLTEYPNLILLRAFTKSYGLAGVRLGYALCSDQALLEDMRRAGPPWAVSQPAIAAGQAALREKDYIARVRELMRTERPWLREQLRALGLTVVPGEANFLLFRSETPLLAPLRERGILLRGCGDFTGLDDTWYRAAVRTREDNERLIAALREVLA